MNQSVENAENTSFAEAFESSLNFRSPEKGDLLKGTIVSISGNDAFITYGGPTEAVIDTSEIGDKELGDEVEATVVTVSPEVRISTKMLARRATLEMVRDAAESGLPVQGKVAARNKGGFDVNIGGLRAFCPMSQIDMGKISDTDAYVGQDLDFRVIEFGRDGKKLVVSRAALMKEEAAERSRGVLESLQIGSVIKGTVRNVVPFGAFVDIGGIEGLLHVSEMSRRRIQDPKDFVSVGDEIEVAVLRIENGGDRISLSRKQLEPDPWSAIGDRYQEGTKFTGTVVRKADFGVFVELEPGIDGLIHRSQFPFGVEPNDEMVKPGATVTGWIRELDPTRRRISLAMREVPAGDPWEFAVTKYPTGRVVEGMVERIVEFGAFIEIEPGLTGLLPNSEIDEGDVTPVVGEKIAVKVLSVDSARNRMSLTTQTESTDVEYQPEEGEAKGALAAALTKALGS